MSTAKRCYKGGIGLEILQSLRGAHPISATHLFGYNLKARLKELDDLKKVSIAKKRFFFKPERKNNILHMRIFVDFQKSQTLSRKKG